MPTWAKVLIIGCVVALGGCGAIIGFGVYSMKKFGALPSIPKAQVTIGTPIKWQTLKQWNTKLMAGGIRAANFDADPTDELLILRMEEPSFSTALNPGSYSPSNVGIFDLDGTEHPINIGRNMAMSDGEAWDYDGDGIDEVVVSAGHTEVYSAGGQFVAPLNGNFEYGFHRDVADVDGNGHPDLLLVDPMNGSKLIAFGLQGKQIWTGSAQSSGSWGNVDTDKLAEFIDPYGANGMTGTDMHGQVTQLKGWNVSVGSARYSFDEVDCTDLDGDGEDEVIAPRSGYLNPKSGKYVSFTRPITAGSLYTPSFSEASAAVAGDFDGDGKRELAVIDTGGNSPTYESLGTALVIYGADGTAQYYEEFGKSVAGLAAVHDGKRERLAIMLSDRLLVSP